MAQRAFRLPKAGRPPTGDQTPAAQPPYQAPAHARVPIRASQAEDLVGYSHEDIGSIREFLGEGVAKGSHVRAAVVLVPVQAQSDGIGRGGSSSGRLWRAVSSGISALRRLFKGSSGPRGPRIPIEATQADRDMAVSDRTGM
jgi:hypothetical protein